MFSRNPTSAGHQKVLTMPRPITGRPAVLHVFALVARRSQSRAEDSGSHPEVPYSSLNSVVIENPT